MAKRKIEQMARSEALQDFSSAEQLDQRMVVIGAKSWLLLVMLVGMLALLIAWGTLGTVSNTISGTGMVLHAADLRPITVNSPMATGGVIDVVAPLGEIVEQGHQIASVRNHNLEKQLSTAQDYLALLKSQDAARMKDEEDLIAKQQASVAAEVAHANETLAQTNKLIKMYQDEIADLEELYEKQLISSSQLVQSRVALFSSMQQASQQQSVIARTEAGLESTLSSIEQARLARLQGIQSAENDVDRLTVQHQTATQVVAPIRGRILEHHINRGSVMSPGREVVTIVPVPEGDTPTEEMPPLMGVFYLPFGKGKQVEVGMSAETALPYAPPSRYGYIKGTVTAVRDFVTDDRLAKSLGSEALAQTFTGGNEATLEIEVTFETDSTTTSGLAWTSMGGYPQPIPDLSLCSVRVQLREDRPIELVIPWLKNMAGVDQPPVEDGGPSP